MLEFNAASSSAVLPYTFVQNEFVNDVSKIFTNNDNVGYLIDSEFLWGKPDQEFEGFTQLFFLNKYVELSGSEIKIFGADKLNFAVLIYPGITVVTLILPLNLCLIPER